MSAMVTELTSRIVDHNRDWHNYRGEGDASALLDFSKRFYTHAYDKWSRKEAEIEGDGRHGLRSGAKRQCRWDEGSNPATTHPSPSCDECEHEEATPEHLSRPSLAIEETLRTISERLQAVAQAVSSLQETAKMDATAERIESTILRALEAQSTQLRAERTAWQGSLQASLARVEKAGERPPEPRPLHPSTVKDAIDKLKRERDLEAKKVERLTEMRNNALQALEGVRAQLTASERLSAARLVEVQRLLQKQAAHDQGGANLTTNAMIERLFTPFKEVPIFKKHAKSCFHPDRYISPALKSVAADIFKFVQ